MGRYATTTSLQTLMVGTRFDTATTSLCTKLITHAENEIDKFLSKRYDLDEITTTSMPPMITSICETLTEGYMYQRMDRSGDQMSKRGEALIAQATKNLELLREYKADLIGSDGNVVTDMSNTAYLVLGTPSYSNTFNEDDELNWKVDQDKLDAISEGRDE